MLSASLRPSFVNKHFSVPRSAFLPVNAPTFAPKKFMSSIQTPSQIAALFEPNGVAVIGASEKAGKIGFSIPTNILSGGYKGNLFLINPKGGKMNLEGKQLDVYKSPMDIPGQCDMGVIVVPANLVLKSAEECGKKGMKVLVVITSGFGEVGDHESERKLVEIGKKYNMRIMGPNIFGVYSAAPSLNATFGPGGINKGNIGLITQSGALGVALMGKAILEKIGISSVVSVGNKADVDDTDLLKYYAEDPNTKVVVIYQEAAKDGRALMEVAREVTQKKPVIVIKSGKSARGQKAAASHTGALAGSDNTYNVAFHQSGILRAADADEAFRWAQAFTADRIPKGDNTVIITNGGGIGVLATDSCEKYDVHLLDDEKLTEETFRKHMPSFGSTKNPIDITGGTGDEGYRGSIEAALKEPSIHSVVVLYCETSTTDPVTVAKHVIKCVEEAKEKKPVVVSFIGGEKTAQALDLLNQHNIPAYSSPDTAIGTLAATLNWKKGVAWYDQHTRDYKVDPKALEIVKDTIASVRKDGRIQFLESEALKVLSAFGIPIPKHTVATTVEEAKKAAQEIGFPLVMKVVSEHIVHKSDVGGVVVNIKNMEDVEKNFNAIKKGCAEKVPGANIRGILVEQMLKTYGVETIVGATTDATFGPTVMFGLGGIFVEILKDVVFRVTPVTEKEAKEMIMETKSYKLLTAVRGQKARDIDALATIVRRISLLLDSVRDIAELDINPLLALEQGAIALDARITLKKE